MRQTIALSLLATVCFLGLLAWPSADVAGAPEETGVWIYDLRIVRVDPLSAQVAETAPDWFQDGATTTDKPWPELLRSLKTRGRTTLLLDQRVTGMTGVKTLAEQKRASPVLSTNFRSETDVREQLTTIQSGCRVELTSTKMLSYGVSAKYELFPVARAPASAVHGGAKSGQMYVVQSGPEVETMWHGSHPALNGKTLLLHYREQVAFAGEEQPQAVELYAFITARYVATGTR